MALKFFCPFLHCVPIFSDNIDNDYMAYELNSCQKANKVLARLSFASYFFNI